MQGFLSLEQDGEELNYSQSKSILKIVGAQFVRPLKGFYTSLLPCWVIALSLSKLTITTAQQQLSYMTFLHKCGITIPWHSYHKHQPEASVLFRLPGREWLTWSGFLFTWHIYKRYQPSQASLQGRVNMWKQMVWVKITALQGPPSEVIQETCCVLLSSVQYLRSSPHFKNKRKATSC